MNNICKLNKLKNYLKKKKLKAKVTIETYQCIQYICSSGVESYQKTVRKQKLLGSGTSPEAL